MANLHSLGIEEDKIYSFWSSENSRVNFHLQKSLETFEKKNQLKKYDPTKTFVFAGAENALSRARQG